MISSRNTLLKPTGLVKYFCSSFYTLLSLLLIALPVEAKTPSEVAELVGQNIESLTGFEFIEKPAGLVQKNSYIIDFNQLAPKPNNTYQALTSVKMASHAGENHLDTRDKTLLGFSHSAGKLNVFVNGQLLFASSEKKAQVFTSLDYQLNRYAKNIPLNFKEGDQILLEFTPFDNKPSIKIAPIYANSGMAANKIKFSVKLDKLKTPFAVRLKNDLAHTAWLPQKPQMHKVLKDRLAFADFRYFSGTVVDALQQVSDHFSDLKFQSYINKHDQFFFHHYPSITLQRQAAGVIAGPFDHAERFLLLDDFGPQLVPIINSLSRDGKNAAFYPEKIQLLNKAVVTIKTKIPRLHDGTLTRLTPFSLTVQSDDLFMGGLFLIRASKYLQNKALLEDAVTQTLNFHHYLHDAKTGLYRHGYFAEKQTQTSTSWGRGVGWMALVYMELLQVMPAEHPKRTRVLNNFISFSDAMVKFQHQSDGRWHQVLNDNNSYLETSVTAMFVSALATGVQQGWLKADKYRQAAKLGWQGLTSQIDVKGNVSGIVRGTPIFSSSQAYKNHQSRLNDPRGLGAILYAAVAMDKLLQLP
ncbi:MAG: glycoside hydrolase family 88/105 protein [Thalassotalea sp.]